MDLYQSVIAPVNSELALFKNRLASLLQSDDNDLVPMLESLRNRNGKMMRPILVLLIGKFYGFPTESIYNVATSVELLHTATLLHDDVIDSSMLRRGQASFNAMFGNKVSILFGDYLVSVSLGEMARTGDVGNLADLASLSGTLSVGEIAQLALRSGDSLSEDNYFDIIYRKTACLFSTAARIAAHTCDACDVDVRGFAEFGRLAGLCFQIRDDIFDYYKSDEIGKPFGNDLREGKFTLPAIHALNNSADDWSSVIRDIRNCTASSEQIELVTDYTIKNGGISYAYQCMDKLSQQAISCLPKEMPGQLRDAFQAYLSLIVSRKN